MSDAITLTPKGAFSGRVDGRALAPDRLAGLEVSALAALPLIVEGQGQVRLGDVCGIGGANSDRLICEGDWSQVDGLGAGMKSGRLEIHGSAGSDLGVAMQGGAILVRGNTGGNAGGAAPGASKGMTGGEILVGGNAGRETGARMRRGLIFVAGTTGEDSGRSMIAGTLVIGGAAGANTGLWNKRGSIVVLGTIDLPATYRFACRFHPPIIPLLLGRLMRVYGARISPGQAGGEYRRYSGDLAESGKGEILAWMAA
ncbi:MAG TPA: formylmethanofuran dehydrogenase subunit C [Gemmatimonadales bacterium]|nr:formylmethanofuran dehydrogenase subunit C [Gemmatimonadales bacterium]